MASAITIHALDAGSLTLPERFFITPADPLARRTVPSLSFLVQHYSSRTHKTTRIVFDLGLRDPITEYPAILQKHCSTRQPLITSPSVIDSLAVGGIGPGDIDYVVLSHVHYDHVGQPSDFSNDSTKFIIGPGAGRLLSGETALNNGSHSFFEPDLLPHDRTMELASPGTISTSELQWTTTLSPLLPDVIDFFSDGSLYIVHAPGHLPGHINLFAPNASSTGQSIYLAGDACHDVRLFKGTHDIATWTDETGRRCCIHADIPAAKETILRLAKLSRGEDPNLGETEVIFAHDWIWAEDAKERKRFFPGRL